MEALDDGRRQLGRACQGFSVLLRYHQRQSEEIPIAIGIRKPQAAAAVTCGASSVEKALQGNKHKYDQIILHFSLGIESKHDLRHTNQQSS